MKKKVKKEGLLFGQFKELKYICKQIAKTGNYMFIEESCVDEAVHAYKLGK